jgi:predicted ATPase
MIHSIRVRNFRSIVDVTLSLSPVTVLVGRSGVGKSNLVLALRFLRDALRAGSESHLRDKLLHEWRASRPVTQASNSTTDFHIDFSLSGVKDLFTYHLAIHSQGPTSSPISESLTLGANCLYAQEAKARQGQHWRIHPNTVVVPEAGPIALGRLPSIPEAVLAFTALTTGVGVHSFQDDVLQPARSNQKGLQRNDSGLDDGGGNYLSTLREITRNLQDLNVRKDLVGALQKINPTVSSVELDDLQNPTTAVVGHKFQDKILPLSLAQESDGFRRFYAHLLALYQRPPKQTLVFEHPEDGIHPGALSLLAEEIKAAPQDNRGQVILTTHSPDLLDEFDVECIRVVELRNLQTVVGNVSNEQREALQENLLRAGELLTVDPARIDGAAAEPMPT